MTYLSSGIKAFDKLMGGGYLTGKLHVLYGKYKIGKSIKSMQLSCMCNRDSKYGGLNKPVLYYDTEQFWSKESFDVWYSWFKKRWKDLPTRPNITVVNLDDIFSVARETGFRIEIRRKKAKTEPVIQFPRKSVKPGETVKETFQREDWLERSPMWKRIEKKDYGLVIIDSFTTLFKDVFESVQQNYPGRASAERPFLSGLRSLASRKDIVVILICHGTGSGVGSVPWGGENIPFYSKHIVGILEGDKIAKQKYGDTEALEKSGMKSDTWKRTRKLYRYRHPTYPDGATDYMTLELNKGFVDVIEPATTVGPI